MSEAAVHPRETFDWAGDTAHELAFLDALARGRLHHAWLVAGPEGVGKATFAYRAARRLLGAAAEPALGPLGSAPGDPVCRQIIQRAHPDLMVLQRDPEDGKARRNIPAEEARGLPEFFSKSPASAPYRVAIVDTADDLNVFGANAVLKTLEEPPPRGVLLLITHSPGGLLATIRSRCRRLRVATPEPEAARAFVADRAGVSNAQAGVLLAMAGGAPGAAVRLALEGGLEIDGQARALLNSLPRVDEAATQKIADGFRGAAGAIRFNLFLKRLAAHIHTDAVHRTGDMAAALTNDRWAEAWSDIVAAPGEVEAINLDRGEVFLTTIDRLKALA